MRDAALMQELGVNTIRSYNVDPTLNHDECASIFNSVGIYMVIDVNSPLPGQSIDRSDPSGSYNVGYLQHIFSVVEAFKNYPNVLGFFAGNEIINTVGTGQDNPPYIRAVQRDLKTYIANNAPRQIPVGYSAADVADVLQDTWAYLQCQIGTGTDMSRSDFLGLNDYSWCGSMSSYTISGYNVLVQTFGNTTIPVFFSEYGCNNPEPRAFDEVPVLYGPKMTVLSGGLVYQWTQDASDFGLVQIYSNGSAQLLADYDTLEGKYDTLNVNLLRSSNSTATSLQPPPCSSDLISGDGFSTDFDIPDTPSGADDWISNGIPNPPSGSIVAVTQTKVPYPVYATNGGQLDNLAIKTGATIANAPGAVSAIKTGKPASSPTASASSPSGSSSSSGSAKSSSSSKAVAAAPTAVNVGVVSNAMAAAALGLVAFAL